ATGAQVIFTPHLAPMNRGILATCYARPAADTATDAGPPDPLAVLHRFYAGAPFVVVDERSPSTKPTLASNSPHPPAPSAPAATRPAPKGSRGAARRGGHPGLGLAGNRRPAGSGGVPMTTAEVGAASKAAILVEALPYIRRFWGQVVVVKYGGNALAAAGP